MNLIGDAWIPVLDADGRSATVGLRELYERAHEIRDLALQPPQRIAVTRLLLCITHAALDGPEDEDDWRACKDRIVPESLAYLEERLDRFELYGDRPFLQVRDLVPTDNFRLDKLDFGLAAGDKETLFDHAAASASRVHSPAWTARSLLATQLFAQSSSKITRTEWGGCLTDPAPTHAPGIAESAVHALLRGENMLGSVHLNLATRVDISCDWGAPVWDIDIPNPKSREAAQVVHSYLGRLVPLARAILLAPRSSSLTMVAGLAYELPPAGVEPTATVILKTRNGARVPGYLSTAPDRHPWRDAPSVLAVARAGEPGGPLALLHLLRNADLGVVDVWLGGIALERPGKISDSPEWVFSLPTGLLRDDPIALYSAGVALSDEGKKQLRAAVDTWGKAMRKRGKELTGPRSLAERAYWAALDAQYEILVEIGCSDDPDLGRWRPVVLRAMREAYSSACPHTTPRQIQAFAQGGRLLNLPSVDSQEDGAQ